MTEKLKSGALKKNQKTSQKKIEYAQLREQANKPLMCVERI